MKCKQYSSVTPRCDPERVPAKGFPHTADFDRSVADLKGETAARCFETSLSFRFLATFCLLMMMTLQKTAIKTTKSDHSRCEGGNTTHDNRVHKSVCMKGIKWGLSRLSKESIRSLGIRDYVA